MPDTPGQPASDQLLEGVIEALRDGVPPGNRGPERALATLAAARRRGVQVLAAAAVLILALGVATLWRPDRSRSVRFSLNASASRVTLVGDFNDWNRAADPLRRHDGEWSVTLRLPPGRYRYAFLVDGRRWMADQRSPATEDEFDTPTSVITVAN
ncbi:MAG TPA: isoamylase early set domain-containing protein [Gemmatimonadales bacterium]